MKLTTGVLGGEIEYDDPKFTSTFPVDFVELERRVEALEQRADALEKTIVNIEYAGLDIERLVARIRNVQRPEIDIENLAYRVAAAIRERRE